jgi:MFS family permease
MRVVLAFHGSSLRRSWHECFGLRRSIAVAIRRTVFCPERSRSEAVSKQKHAARFHGWRVVQAAFVLAAFGWGLGFFGPPVFLSVIHESHGWPLVLISGAISLHFLIGAVVGANLPALHRRFGAAAITKTGAVAMAAGLAGWSMANAPWHLFVAATLSGAGWATMSAAALNAIVSPWFARTRPLALSMAYNGGSVGGIVFSPLWVAGIGALGFPVTACAVAAVTVTLVWALAERVFSKTPEMVMSRLDGDALDAPAVSVTSAAARPLPGLLLWRDLRFRTLAAGMTLGLFAQIGLMAHLFSLLVPALGAQRAGLAMSLVTVMAMTGRTLVGWLMPPGADRRLLACGGYVLQAAGCVAFMLAGGTNVALLVAGVVLFGLGFGNATSLPPLIAQAEFVREDVTRVAALIVAISQAGYAAAPAFFGVVRELTTRTYSVESGDAPMVFAAAAFVQCLAIAAFLSGRRCCDRS